MPAAPRRRRLAVALAAAAVVGGAGGLTVSLLTPVSYTAKATLLVSSSSSGTTLLQSSGFADPVRTSWESVATTPLVLDPVIAELHLDTSAAALAGRIHADTPENSTLLEISVTDPSAAGATRLANAVQDRLVTIAPSLTPTTTSAQPADVLRSVQRAAATQSGPSAVVLALSGVLAGVLVWAVVVAVLLIVRMPRPPRGQPAPSML